jgi:hypothetical protein
MVPVVLCYDAKMDGVEGVHPLRIPPLLSGRGTDVGFHLFKTKHKIPSGACALNTTINKVLQFQSACHVNCVTTFLFTCYLYVCLGCPWPWILLTWRTQWTPRN